MSAIELWKLMGFDHNAVKKNHNDNTTSSEIYNTTTLSG